MTTERETAGPAVPMAALIEPPDLIAVPAGWFRMGSADRAGRDDERPAHRVWIAAFEMGRCQVTNREYARFLEATGRRPPPFWNQPAFANPDQPVAGPSWFDAAAYCEWLCGVVGPGCRLPTEAEWERAARGGEEARLYPWGDSDPSEQPGYASRWRSGPEPAGGGAVNAYGLYDIGENVHEWCLDWYDARFYEASPERNPLCRQAGTDPRRRASRGGSWRHRVKIARSAARSAIPPDFHYADYGFRIVRGTLDPEL